MYKLKEIIQYAGKNSEYYRSIFLQNKINIDNITLDDFKKIPYLNKSIIINNKEKIISNEFSNSLVKTLSVNLTSGTSGKPIEILWDNNDLLKSNLHLWRLRSNLYGIKPSDRYCSLHTSTYVWNRVNVIEKIKYSNDKKNLSLCKLFSDDNTLLEYYKEVFEFKPVWLFVQPSFILRFIEFMKKNNLVFPNSIKYIEFSGETLNNHTRNIVNNYCNCRIANMYGTMETNGIAYEYPDGRMHLINENVYLEIVDIDEQTNIGKVILTSLTNKAFPLIRYDIGDYMKVSFNNDNSLLVKEVLGRTNSIIVMKNNVIIKEYIIAYCFERTIAIIGDFLKEYKIKKISEDVIEIKIFLFENFNLWKKTIEKELNNLLSSFYESITFNISYVKDYFPINDSGKFSIFDL